MIIPCKRAIPFAGLYWLIAFVVISILMFFPWIKGNELRVQAVWWVLQIPITLMWAKAYFKADPPTIKKGVALAVTTLLIGAALDAAITVPFFVHSYAEFFGDAKLYVGYAIFTVLVVYAGWEYDKTYTSSENKQ